MKKDLIIAPSVLSLDFANATKQLQQLDQSAAKWLHFDVMDGHFVPNLTFGPDILKGFHKAVHKIMDVHIMVSDPKTYAKVFIEAGANVLTFHMEAVDSLEEMKNLCQEIRQMGCLAGVSLRPKSDIKPLLPYLKELDVVLIMSVEPGFGGQSFMEDQLEKVRILRNEIDSKQLDVRIEIDGGINSETAKLAIDAGCDTLVAGSFVFKQDIVKAVDELLCLG